MVGIVFLRRRTRGMFSCRKNTRDIWDLTDLGPFCQCRFSRCFFVLFSIFGSITYLKRLHVEKKKQHVFWKNNTILKIAQLTIFKTMLFFPKTCCFFSTSVHSHISRDESKSTEHEKLQNKPISFAVCSWNTTNHYNVHYQNERHNQRQFHQQSHSQPKQPYKFLSRRLDFGPRCMKSLKAETK